MFQGLIVFEMLVQQVMLLGSDYTKKISQAHIQLKSLIT